MAGLNIGDRVVIPWGLDEVEGHVVDVYGAPPRVHVVVELTPEGSGFVVGEASTFTFPVDAVRPAGAAASGG